METPEIITGRRGGLLILYHNFLYKRNRVRRDKCHWECSYNGCNVRMHTSAYDATNVIGEPYPHHIHGYPTEG